MTAKPADKRFLRALAGQPVDRPPFWLMRQAGRYLDEYQAVRAEAGDFLTLCYTPDYAVEVTLQPIRRFGMDAAILFSDILVVPDGLGQTVAFRKGEGPVLQPWAEVADRLLGGFDRAAFVDHLAPVYETVARLRRELPAETALIGFAGAPWTVATYMVEGRGGSDFAAIKQWAYRDPDGFAVLIDRLVDATTAHLDAQIRSGAEAVQIFDTWAGALSEPQFRRWSVAPTAEIVRRLKADHPTVPVIGFPRGAGALYIDYARETCVDGLSLDAGVPLAWARSALQPVCAVQGNLDNQLLVVGGAAMEREIERILSSLADGAFVFNLGHGILPQTPPSHVARLADILRAWPAGGDRNKEASR